MVINHQLPNTAMAMLVAITAGMLPAIAGEPISTFIGYWRVARVAVPDVGVQALDDDDPSLLGKSLTFTRTQLAWDETPLTKDMCTDPSLEPLDRLPPDMLPELRKLGMHQPVAYTVHCRLGTWGPGRNPVMYRDATGVVALPWYDGALLMLLRQST